MSRITLALTTTLVLAVAVLRATAQQPDAPQQPANPATADLPQAKPAPVPGTGKTPTELPRIPLADPRAATVPQGFRVEIVAADLTYPTSVEFDGSGNLYIAEAGFNYGDDVAPARILRISPRGAREVVADQLSAPVTDLLWHANRLYISHRGKISALEGRTIRDLVTGLPSLGDHQNNQLTAGPDGKIYFGQGTVTNSGVVGLDNFLFGWLAQHPDAKDIPARDIKLKGQEFSTPDPIALFARKEHREAKTSAFHAFGQTASAEPVVRGAVKANGTILRFNPDGSSLEVYAWGLRNPFGVLWGPDRKLYVTEAGYDERGSRPIANAPDCLWVIREGAWYGFPDFAGGMPVTDPRFHSDRGPAAEFLLAEHPAVEKPALVLPPHTDGTKFDFSRHPQFGQGHMYLALAGDMIPETGKPAQHPDTGVVQVDMRTLKISPFFGTRRESLGPKGFEHVSTAGPRRPVDVRFSPGGEALYVADIGALTMIPTEIGPKPRPFPGTGVVWRIIAPGTQGR